MSDGADDLTDLVLCDDTGDADGATVAKARELLALSREDSNRKLPPGDGPERAFNVALNGAANSIAIILQVADNPSHETASDTDVQYALIAQVIATEIANDWCCRDHAIEAVTEIAERALAMAVIIHAAREKNDGLAGAQCQGRA